MSNSPPLRRKDKGGDDYVGITFVMLGIVVLYRLILKTAYKIEHFCIYL